MIGFRNLTDIEKRARLIKDSRFNVLRSDDKARMVKNPQRGLVRKHLFLSWSVCTGCCLPIYTYICHLVSVQFWHVDHITPVVEGGGMCDLDNLRTLCTVCHRDVTAQQTRARVQNKKRQKSAGQRDLLQFFGPPK